MHDPLRPKDNFAAVSVSAFAYPRNLGVFISPNQVIKLLGGHPALPWGPGGNRLSSDLEGAGAGFPNLLNSGRTDALNFPRFKLSAVQDGLLFHNAQTLHQ